MKQYSQEDSEYISNGHYEINGVEYMSIWTYKNKKHIGDNSTQTNASEARIFASKGFSNKTNQVSIENNHNSSREIPVVKDSTRIIKNENEINFSMPIAKTISFKVKPIEEESFGYSSTNKDVKVNVVNLASQILKIRMDLSNLKLKFSKQDSELNKIRHYYYSKIDSIVNLNKNFTFNEKESILTLFMIDKFEIDKVSIFNKNETLKNTVLKLNGRYFELKSIKNPTALKEIRDVEITDYCESLE